MKMARQRDMESTLFLILTVGICQLWAQTAQSSNDVPMTVDQLKENSAPSKREVNSNQYLSRSVRDRHVLSGFMGMRGKKSIYDSDFSDGSDYLDKRIPSGFIGMRGKKIPSGFVGMRGKKIPSGFVGMRGKKAEYTNYEDENDGYNGLEDHLSPEELSALLSLYQQRQALENGPYVVDESGQQYLLPEPKRSLHSGFHGLRGKRHAEVQRNRV